jgi:hypothetical protein
MNTDAQSAGPPELRAPTKPPTVKPQYSTINSRSSCLACWAWLRSSLAVAFRSRFAGSGFASPRCSRAPAGARSSARVPAGACCWLQLTVSFGARRHSVGPCEVRLLAVVCGLRVLIAVPEQLFPRPAVPPSRLCGARTLSQQEKNNSADVQRGKVNRSSIICTSSNGTIAAMYLRRVRVVGRGSATGAPPHVSAGRCDAACVSGN